MRIYKNIKVGEIYLSYSIPVYDEYLHPNFVDSILSKKGVPLGNWTCHDEPPETHGLRANWFKVQGSSLGVLITGLWGMCDSFAPSPYKSCPMFLSKSQQFYANVLHLSMFFCCPIIDSWLFPCTLLQPPGTKRDRRFRPWVVWVINFGRLWTCVRIAGPEAVWCWQFLINIGRFPQIRSSHKQTLPCIWYCFHNRNLLHPQNL